MRKAFTIIEIMVVIAIIGILFIIAKPKFGEILEKSKERANIATVRGLNDSTKLYIIKEKILIEDAFNGIEKDEDRIKYLINNNYIEDKLGNIQNGICFFWNTDKYRWEIANEENKLTIFGNSFNEIVEGFIETIKDNYNKRGTYGRTWGDFRYTDIGLNSEDWIKFIDHKKYIPRGKEILVTPQEGYKFEVINNKGEKRYIWYNQNIIYNVEKENWELSNGEEIDIDTLVLKKRN